MIISNIVRFCYISILTDSSLNDSLDYEVGKSAVYGNCAE